MTISEDIAQFLQEKTMISLRFSNQLQLNVVKFESNYFNF